MTAEDHLHMAVADYLNLMLRAPVFWTTFPAGSGGKARGGQLKAKGLKAGVPDILIIKAGIAHWIELKTEDGKLNKAQKVTVPEIRQAGCPVAVCRSVPDVEQVLKGWGFSLTGRVAA